MFVLLFPILPPKFQILNLNIRYVWIEEGTTLGMEAKNGFDFCNMTNILGYPKMESITNILGQGVYLMVLKFYNLNCRSTKFTMFRS